MRDNAFDMKRFVCIFVLAAVLGVWMPGVGAYVSEDWRSDSVMSVRDFQQIDAELGSQKTLVPGVESKWIICRNDPINCYDPDGRETQLAQGLYTEGNPAGHIAWVINGTVYSHHSTYSGGSDWGVSEDAYFSGSGHRSGESQDSRRQTLVHTLNVSEEQELVLEQYLQNNDPNVRDYCEFTFSCVTSTEMAAEATGILPEGPIVIISPLGVPTLVFPTSISPADLVNQFSEAGLIESTESRGNKPKVSVFQAIVNAVVNLFSTQ